MDWLGIIIATIASYLLGWIWYSDKLFGKTWKQGHDMQKENLEGGHSINVYAQSIIMTLVYCFILATLMNKTENHSCMADGMKLGFMVGLGIVMMAFGIQYSFLRRPFSLLLIDGAYYVLMSAIAGAIIGSFSAY